MPGWVSTIVLWSIVRFFHSEKKVLQSFSFSLIFSSFILVCLLASYANATPTGRFALESRLLELEALGIIP